MMTMTKTLSLFAAGLVATAVAPRAARAQDSINLASLDEQTHRLHLTTGAEYSFVAGIGYSHITPMLDRKIVLGADVRLPVTGLDVNDWSVRIGALVPIVGTQRWKLAGSLAPMLRGNETRINRMMDVGLDTSVVGGFYMRHFFVAAEAGVDLALSTHVSHSDEYRMTVHAGAKDGWYGNPGANLRGGLQAGASFSRYDVVLRAGQVRDVNGEPPLFPFYATLTGSARW